MNVPANVPAITESGMSEFLRDSYNALRIVLVTDTPTPFGTDRLPAWIWEQRLTFATIVIEQ